MDSAPSASVGLHGVNTSLYCPESGIHFANSEASLLKIHHNRHDNAAASLMVNIYIILNAAQAIFKCRGTKCWGPNVVLL